MSILRPILESPPDGARELPGARPRHVRAPPRRRLAVDPPRRLPLGEDHSPPLGQGLRNPEFLEGPVDYYRLTAKSTSSMPSRLPPPPARRDEPDGERGAFRPLLHAVTQVNGMTELRRHALDPAQPRAPAADRRALYADLIENAFLNGFLAGVSRDGRWGAHIVRS